MNNAKKYLTSRFLFTVICILILFFIAELGLRKRAESRFGEAKASYYVSHPILGKTLKPNFVREGKLGTLRINSLGFRGDEFTPVPEKGVIRIFCIGDSVVFGGNGEEDAGGVWPEAIEQTFNQQSTETEIEVINAGVPGWGSFQVQWNLENRIVQYQPDIVIIYAMPGTIPGVMKTDKKEKFVGKGSINFLKNWHKKNSIFYDLLKKNTRELRADTAAGEFVSFPTKKAENKFYQDYKKLVAICKKNNIIPVLVSAAHPFREDQPPSIQNDRFNAPFYGLGLQGAYEAFAALNSAVEQVARDEGVAFIDLEERLTITDKTFLDNVHFAPEGHRQVAKILTDVIKSKILNSPDLEKLHVVQ